MFRIQDQFSSDYCPGLKSKCVTLPLAFDPNDDLAKTATRSPTHIKWHYRGLVMFGRFRGWFFMIQNAATQHTAS
jgi:hypothetical protein